MDGLFVLALSPEDFSPETLALTSTKFSAAELSDREDLRRQGDSELITQLLTVLKNPATPLASTLVNISELSLLGQWAEVYHKAINHSDFLDWADRRQLDFNTLQVRNGVLLGREGQQTTLQRFTLADESRWWKVANPIIYIAQLLDPAELGMPYIGGRVDNPARMLTLDRVLAFYGYPMPANRLQALVIAEELSAADAFPSIDAFGRSRSLLQGERLEQQLDFQHMADALQSLAPLEDAALLSTRLNLASGSLLSRTLKEAARHLSAIVEDNGEEGVQAAGGAYYFDHIKQAIHVQPRPTDDEPSPYELRPETPGWRWNTLVRLAKKLALDIYPDHSLSLAACLQAYGIAPATTETTRTALIARLRQWPMAPPPTLYAAARSLDERHIYSSYIGVLNDRHALRDGLYRAINVGNLDGPEGLDAIVEIDTDTLPPKLLPARLQLRELITQPEFTAILLQQKIDPGSHVLFTTEGGFSARAVDGSWKSVTLKVMANPRLVPMVQKLSSVAAQLGGELRTNEAISLRQALRLYNIPLPTTLEAARLTAHRRVITVPHTLHESNYWRALSPAQATHPTGWTLSEADRQRIISSSQSVMTDTGQHLFDYLSETVLQGTSLPDVRAEADLLMTRLIASPRAQQLASQLAHAVRWQGSDASVIGGHAGRSALVWAALILSLDPNAGTHPTRINGLDWADDYFWGESVAFVRLQVENSFRNFAPSSAALAAHLMLCGQAPHLLVRDIPDSLPFLCTQAWVLFEQYATYLEQRVPGAARQMSHDEIMYLAYLPLRGSWRLFLGSTQATPPILAWAATNSLLPRQARYTAPQTNAAISALNALRARLQAAQEVFDKPVPGQRQVALEALKKVYPYIPLLEDLVWEWAPASTDTNDDSALEQVHRGKKYSFVDLYMANELVITSGRWVSTNPDIQYRGMAHRFEQLPAFGQVFAQAFEALLLQVKTAYIDYLQSLWPALSLLRRQALEFGKVEFFSVRKGSGPVGTFGLIVCASFYGDRHVYECFPKYLLMRPRRDVDYNTLVAAAASTSQAVPDLAFEWPAYATGAEPSEHTPVQITPGLHIRKLAKVLPAAETLPAADAEGKHIPRSIDSPRSQAMATQIIADHYLQGGVQLHALANVVPKLEELSRGDDPWADFLLSMALAAK